MDDLVKQNTAAVSVAASPTPVPRGTQKDELTTRLVVNTAANFSGQAVIFALMFLATPYIVRHFGPDRYGVFVLLLTYTEFFSLLNLGINTSLVKYISELLPQGRQRDINDYVGTAFVIFTAVGAVIAVSVTLSSEWLAGTLFHLSPELHRSAVVSLWIASAVFLIRFIGQAFAAIPVAAQRFDIVNYINVGTESVRIVASVAVIYWGYLLEAVMLATFFATLLSSVTNYVVARRLVPDLSCCLRVSPTHLRNIVQFSKYVIIANLSGRIVDSLDKIIVGYFLPVASVAFYAIPYAIGQKLWALVGNVTAVLFPAASALSNSSSRGDLQELYLRGSKLVAALASFPALALCLFSRGILLYWIGPEFAEEGALTLSLLGIAFLVNCLVHTPYITLQAAGYPGIAAKFCGMYAIITVGLMFILVPLNGVVGAAVSFLVAQVILTPWFIHSANALIGIDWRTLLRLSYLPIIVTTSLSCLASAILAPWVSSLSTLILIMLIGLAVHWALAAALVLDRKERETVIHVMARGLGVQRFKLKESDV